MGEASQGCQALTHVHKLLQLKQMQTLGILTPSEFEANKQQLFNSNPETIPVGCAPLVPPSPSSEPARAAIKDTEQRTLFSMGVSKTFTKGTDIFTITSSTKTLSHAPPARFPCRFCPRQFNHGPARSAHERTHTAHQQTRLKVSHLNVVDSNGLPLAVRQCVNDMLQRYLSQHLLRKYLSSI